MAEQEIPTAFWWRRAHSLAGLWLVLFLLFHLLTNSQAALFFGNDGKGFIREVNFIHSLPYLPAIEMLLLAVPFLVHIVWGLHYLLTAKPNSFRTDGSAPDLPYRRNKAYTWMRISSWILLVAVIGHVVHMRFVKYPWSADYEGVRYYMTVVDVDSGLYTLSDRLKLQLYDEDRIAELEMKASEMSRPLVQEDATPVTLLEGPVAEPFDVKRALALRDGQDIEEQQAFASALQRKSISRSQVVAVADSFGTASLMVVRETFKSPLMVALYSLFVLVACYHAFNGLWTFLITWGITVTEKSQRMARVATTTLMVVVAFLGLVSAIGTYWINLRI